MSWWNRKPQLPRSAGRASSSAGSSKIDDPLQTVDTNVPADKANPILSDSCDQPLLTDSSELAETVTGSGEPWRGRGKWETQDLEQPRVQLVLYTREEGGTVYAVDRDIIVGRGLDADIRISNNDVSRRHAAVRPRPDGEFVIEDLGSHNGTRVNGTAIKKTALNFGDRISIGAQAILLFTHRGRLEDRLLESQKLESIGQLAGGIAHEFNNLLFAVIANIDYVRSAVADPSQGEAISEALTDAKKAIVRASDLTQQLLAFARRAKYEERPTDLSATVAEVANFVRKTFDRAITVEAQIEHNVAVLGDETQLHQAIMNLCLNSRDAMPQGGRLRISVENRPLSAAELSLLPSAVDGPYAVVEVADTGCGMAEETCRRAFEPFYTTKAVGRGTGLGLAMVYGIVRAHGGHVRLDSQEGKGTVALAYLPLCDLPVHRAPTDAPTPGPVQLHGTVLLVDDDPVVRTTTERLLRKWGLTVLTASDGREALSMFRTHRGEIRVVLLDLIMPNMPGEETFTALRRLDPKIRVLIVSGQGDSDRANTILSRGAEGMLAKPYTAETLGLALAEALS